MSLERHPTKPGTWVIRLYSGKRTKEPTTGKASNRNRPRIYFEGTEPEALAYYASLLQTQPAPTLPALLAPTLKQAWPDFCLYYENLVSTGTYHDYLHTWSRHLAPYFGDLRPGQLTAGLIEQYKNRRRQETYLPGKRAQLPELDTAAEKLQRRTISKKTINKELSYLSSMTTWMAAPDVNKARPLQFTIKGFPAKQVEAPLPNVPSRSEMIRFMRACDRKYRAIFMTCYYTGKRKSEVLKLTGDRVDLEWNIITILGKGNKQTIIPIHRKLIVYLRKAWQKGYLWLNPTTGNPYTDLSKPMARAAEKAGVAKHFHLHLFRHSFGTHLIAGGADLRSVQMLMDHSSITVTQKYITLGSPHLIEQLNKIGGGSGKQRPKAVANKS